MAIPTSNRLSKVDQLHIISTADNEVWSTGERSETLQGKHGGPIEIKGYWAAIKVRGADAWKERMETWETTPSPAAPAQTK